MKQLFILAFSLTAITCYGQFDKGISFRATANVNIVLKGLGTNDAGAGLGLDASLFSKHRLQFVFEASADRFIGNKLLVFDTATGKKAKGAAAFTLRVGPQFFVANRVALALTYGPSWYVVQDFDYSMNGGFKYSVTGFLGRERRCVVKVFMVDINGEVQHIKYFGLAAGVRF